MEHRKKLEKALAFFGPNGTGNEEDFALLYEDGRRVIRDYLGKSGCSATDSEDVAQKVFISVYLRRAKLEFPDLNHWRAYVKKAAQRVILDKVKGEKPGEDEEVPYVPPDIVEEIAKRELLKKLYAIADRIWLGAMPEEDADIKILAATFLYADGLSATEVLGYVAGKCRGTAPTTESELLDWVSHVAVLRRVAYNSLYYSNEELSDLLLGTGPVKGGQAGAAKWNPTEAGIIRHRYRHGTSMAHIPISIRGALTSEDISSITARCRARFPFVYVMTLIWSRLDGHSLRKEVLTKNSLWKRLVFQYHVRDELPQEDILERVSAPALVAGYELNNVNTWVASRLREELKKHMDEADDE